MKQVIRKAMCIGLLASVAACGQTTTPEPQGPSLPVTEGGQSSVSLQHGGETIEMAHMRAVRFINADGSEELRLFFSDDPLDDVVVIDFFGGDELREWAMPDRENVRNLIDLRVPANDPHSGYEGSVYPVGPIHAFGESAFTALELTPDRVSGELSAQDSLTLRDTGEPRWQFNGGFEAPVTLVRIPDPMTGADILETPQARSLFAMMERAAGGDMREIRPLVTREAWETYQRQEEMLGAETMKTIVTSLGGTRKEIQAALQNGMGKLWEAGKRARLNVTEETDSGSSSVSFDFRWQDGHWLID